MTRAILSTVQPASLEPEWRRVEILCRCLQQSRRDLTPDDALLTQLTQVQNEVNALRAAGTAWTGKALDGLGATELDILATVLASEAQPRVAWHFQELQAGVAQPYPTRALIQTLLALEGPDMAIMHKTLQCHGGLVARKLIHLDGEGAFQIVRPSRRALVELLDWPMDEVPPPGSLPVHDPAQWDELVLPCEQRQMLKEYLLWVRHHDTVVGRWRGQRTGGPVALLAGPSGTGKTLAARVLATDIGWPLYRVDLARLVSKYIGETEKNLSRLFDAAHDQKLVLLFDEVDSLMSKRGEISEARDRYANMEVSYLLARIEDHHGPCLLTTNLRQQIDKAFTRRLQMVVEFPRPDQHAREQLWQRLIPPGAPCADDVDFAFVAASVNMTGGSIRNAALHAAYLAAEAGTPVSMAHIAVSVWRELAKERQQIHLSDLGPLRAFLPADLFTQEETP